MRSQRFGSFILLLTIIMIFGYGPERVFAQDNTSTSVLYVPLIGITMVPDPLVLPLQGGKVTYNYAVKNFLQEQPLTSVTVSDDNCKSIKFVGGDDNGDSKLDASETWRYVCTTNITQSTQSTATATGIANNITATHKAYAKVIVGSNNPPPLVSIVNISKIAYPLSLPVGGGDITYTYKVNNPGVTPLSDVTVTDDKCSSMSSKLGDTNANNLLDTNEVWIFTCVVNLKQTTTNTVTVSATSNGLKATDNATLTVKVDIPNGGLSLAAPNFPDTGTNPDFKIMAWEIMAGVLGVLVILFLVRKNTGKSHKNSKAYRGKK